jgi:RHS repeat-associated protein
VYDSGRRSRCTGKERDTETGLDYFGARYFSGAQGRFTSPDEFPGGIVDPFTGQEISQPGPLPYADITDPQTLNKYAYVRNNPLRYTDPDGHCTDVLTCGIAIGEAAAAFGGYVTAAAGGALGGLAVYLASPAVGGSGGPSPNPGHYFAESVDNSIKMSGNAQGSGQSQQAQGQQSTPGDPNDPNRKLTRYGDSRESATRLGKKAAESEAKQGVHGVSTTINPAAHNQPGNSTADRSAVEAHFPVQQTGRDQQHHTVVLPKPVTRQVADLFNKIFGR